MHIQQQLFMIDDDSEVERKEEECRYQKMISPEVGEETRALKSASFVTPGAHRRYLV